MKSQILIIICILFGIYTWFPPLGNHQLASSSRLIPAYLNKDGDFALAYMFAWVGIGLLAFSQMIRKRMLLVDLELYIILMLIVISFEGYLYIRLINGIESPFGMTVFIFSKNGFSNLFVPLGVLAILIFQYVNRDVPKKPLVIEVLDDDIDL